MDSCLMLKLTAKRQIRWRIHTTPTMTIGQLWLVPFVRLGSKDRWWFVRQSWHAKVRESLISVR